MSQKQLVGVHQGLDAAGGGVQCGGKLGDFVPAFDGHSRRKIARSELGYARLQVLEAAGQLTDERVESYGDG